MKTPTLLIPVFALAALAFTSCAPTETYSPRAGEPATMTGRGTTGLSTTTPATTDGRVRTAPGGETTRSGGR